VEKLDLRVGDRVFLERAGDVIPQVMGVAEKAPTKVPADWDEAVPEELRDEEGGVRAGVTWRHGDVFAMPEACPACGTPSEKVGKYWLCPNGLDCSPQLVGRTTLLAGRGAFEIERLGKKLIEQLVAEGLLSSPPDIFHLDPADLIELERWGEKSVENLMDELQERRTVPFDRFLVALVIPEVGTATARLLARGFDGLEPLRAATEEELEGLEGIGPEMAGAIAGWFASEHNQAFLTRLFAGGVVVQAPESTTASTDGPFADKTVVVTGSLEALSRAEAKRLVEDLGGRVVSSVSKKTDYVIVGESPGSKRKRAEELGVELLDEEAFLRLAGRSG
jgi:DNA ligase (NAD+)